MGDVRPGVHNALTAWMPETVEIPVANCLLSLETPRFSSDDWRLTERILWENSTL
tara:strand:- start:325227 stop:325391 length:165 start_codon:yes stop_codon:yes gene_type:complete